jgi:hypothetical protein
MDKKLFSVVLIIAIVASACAISARVRARQEMEASKASYKSCLSKNPSDPSQCEGLRQAYEADLESYKALKETSKD